MAEPARALLAGSPGPFHGTYWVLPGQLLAGPYPGRPDPYETEVRIGALRDAGVRHLFDLTFPAELPPYAAQLPEPFDADAMDHLRRPIRDHGVPEPLQMAEILDQMEELIDGGECVYVHCRAGIGRTGTVVGCYLARLFGDGELALDHLMALWQASGRYRDYPHVPETVPQQRFIGEWMAHDPRGPVPVAYRRPPAAVGATAPLETATAVMLEQVRDRYRGLFLGLAIGDALGMPVQHRRPGSFTPIGDLLGGGPYDLPRGSWTDDTAVMLCLAESLVEQTHPDLVDMQTRLASWQREGHLSSTGQCVGISAATARAIAAAQWSGNPLAGSHDPSRLEREPLVRVGAAIAFAHPDLPTGLRLALDTIRLTHQAPLLLDGARVYAALLSGALRGLSPEELLTPGFVQQSLPDWSVLRPELLALLQGGWRDYPPHRLAGAGAGEGGVLEGLAVAFSALHRGRQNFRDGVLWAVNLGGEADTNGALAGQLLGAVHGAAALPPNWVAAVARRPLLESLADRLLAAALAQLAAAAA